MHNFILIDGIAFWVILIYLILQFLFFVLIGNSYLKCQKEIDLKDKQLRMMRKKYNVLLGKYYKETFKVPEVEKDG